MSYLPNATNFDGIEIKDKPNWTTEKQIYCPLCHGHGEWNLELNAYGPGRNFQAVCSQCNGYGWVKKGTSDETCIHDWHELSMSESRAKGYTHFGMCYHVYQCTKCHKMTAQDSSD